MRSPETETETESEREREEVEGKEAEVGGEESSFLEVSRIDLVGRRMRARQTERERETGRQTDSKSESY